MHLSREAEIFDVVDLLSRRGDLDRYPIRTLRDVEHEAMIELDFTEAAFATLASEYHSRKQLAEQQVVEWKWASWRVFYQKPLALERGGYAPGRMLKQKPSETNNCVEYGFDHERRILVERRYTEGVGFYEIFLKWSETLIESAVYDCAPDKKPINIEFVELVEGKAVRSISSAVNGCSIERYIWTGLQLTTVHQDTKERVNSETPELLRTILPSVNMMTLVSCNASHVLSTIEQMHRRSCL